MAYTTINGVDSITVAKAFCVAMRQELNIDQMQLVIERNRNEPSDAICHTHDFCDANVVMDEVCKRLNAELEFQPDENDEAKVQKQCDLWNEAWSIAKYAAFHADRVDAVVADVEKNGY